MVSASSSNSALRRRRPHIPLIPCPDCGRTVKRSVSGTAKHTGWTFYKCERHGHGCIFWHWELEYVGHLLDHDYLVGDDAVDALGWAEERREELEARQAERVATGSAGPGAKQEKNIKTLLALLHEVKKIALLLQIAVVLLAIMCVLLGIMCVLLILKK